MKERWTPKSLKDYPPKRFARMLARWRKDPSSEPELEKWYATGAPYGIPFCEREPERWEIEHKEYFPVYQKAVKLEKASDLEKALSLYMQILRKYVPHGTVYYERPAIILERMGRYKEAIAICNMAISALEKRLFNADIEPFLKRKVRLEKKNRPGVNVKKRPPEIQSQKTANRPQLHNAIGRRHVTAPGRATGVLSAIHHRPLTAAGAA